MPLPGLSSSRWGRPTSQGSPTSGYQASEVVTDVLIYVSQYGIWNWASGSHDIGILSFLGLGWNLHPVCPADGEGVPNPLWLLLRD